MTNQNGKPHPQHWSLMWLTTTQTKVAAFTWLATYTGDLQKWADHHLTKGQFHVQLTHLISIKNADLHTKWACPHRYHTNNTTCFLLMNLHWPVNQQQLTLTKGYTYKSYRFLNEQVKYMAQNCSRQKSGEYGCLSKIGRHVDEESNPQTYSS